MTRSRPMSMLRVAPLFFIAVLQTACTSMNHYRDRDPNPEHRLDALLQAYEQASATGESCLELWQVDSATIDCSRILREVERLYVEYPRNPRILMSNAVLSYEAGQKQNAQFMLDELLAQNGAHPEAAILRSHLALEEGNSRLARELLERQITLAPNRADLREALAAAHYTEGDYTLSRAMLGIAGRLGTPGWRLSYHHGLICEAEKTWEAACRFYKTALEQKPDYLPAQSRLVGLSQHAVCRDNPSVPGLSATSSKTAYQITPNVVVADPFASDAPEVVVADPFASDAPEVVVADPFASDAPEVAIADPFASDEPEVVVADPFASDAPEVVVADPFASDEPEVVVADPFASDAPEVVVADPFASDGAKGVASKTEHDPYYVVNADDTLWSIARKHNMFPAELIAINDLEANAYIYPGQTLQVRPVDTAELSTGTGIEQGYYLVQAGDSLGSIAYQFDISVMDLATNNGLARDDIIYAGQTLRVIP